MHFIYELVDDNVLQARRLYQEQCVTRRCPNKETFERIHRHLCEHGSFAYLSGNKERPKNTAPEMEEEILDIISGHHHHL